MNRVKLIAVRLVATFARMATTTCEEQFASKGEPQTDNAAPSAE
ncbi:MAG: hypothetical protein ABIT36_10980 [Steroidobacteraceae bacterium]